MPSPHDALNEAFGAFTEAADSLESFYSSLRDEVGHLRSRLDQTNRQLSASLEANRRMRQYLERILDALPCGVLVVDTEGELQLVNPEAERLLGSVGPASAVVSSMAGLNAVPDEAERELALEDGQRVKHLGLRSRILPGGPAGGGRICILRDLTEEKELQEEKEAARRVQALADMSALLAHEVRNPLGSLELFAGLVADAPELGTEAREWADQLHAGLRTLAATVNNVLQFHHSDSGDMRVACDAVGILTETVAFIAPMARQWNAEVRVSGDAGPQAIVAEPHDLRQVFLNLAMNAFSAMPSGGRLDIGVLRRTQQDGGEIEIEFRDQGRGISAQDLGDIFDPGFSTKPNSSGLGLAVCRRIVEKSGGTIVVRSTPGIGTVFTLTFRAAGESLHE